MRQNRSEQNDTKNKKADNKNPEKRVHEKTRGRKVQGVGLKTFHLNRIKIQVAMFDMIQEKQL